ncbi:MAG: tetratricopeptide repeat protein, partial [Gemmatimonadota bacterium]|nr:tetratricopeptide repeat protein [Gemmatimonadota bacterium]
RWIHVVAIPALLGLPLLGAVGQAVDPRLTQIDSLHDAVQPAAALVVAKALLAENATDYGALWRAARSQVDIAKRIKGDHEYTRQVRDSVYAVAEDYARRAIAVDSTDAEGHFILGVALGQLSRTRGGKERVSFARDIYDEAALALAADPDHDGAHHVLGAWHAEIMRLSGITRFVAKTILGAGFMDRASWDSAAVHLEQAVALDPTYIHHRLELAEIYADMERWADAAAQLEAIPSLPTRDVLDGDHRANAAALLENARAKLR